MRKHLLIAGVVVALLAVSIPAQAAWVEVRSANFTIVTDAGEGSGRDVAWQFEQVRSAILAGWPWARPRLDRPVIVVAAKDEASMRLLVPQLFENRDRNSVTTSLLSSAPDRYVIVLRNDVKSEDRAGTINPYYSSYWSYSYLSLNAAFEGQLPLWFVEGLAEVLSNSLIAKNHIDFGRPAPWVLDTLLNEPRLRLAELLEVTSDSPYHKDSATLARFRAQSWGVLQYLLYGGGKDQPDRVNEIAKRLLAGQTSAQAIAQVFGSVEALESAYREYQRRPITQFLRLQVDSRIPRDFPVRTLTAAQAAMTRAGIHAVFGRTADASALVSDARKTEPVAPDGYVTEALLLDIGRKPQEAAAAYAKAVELGSDNFYPFYRVAADLARRNDAAARSEAESHAARAVALNAFHGPSHSLLGSILARGADPAKGLPPAQRGVALDPTDSDARYALATVFLRMERRSDALGQALAARALARTPERKADVQELIDRLSPPVAPAR